MSSKDNLINKFKGGLIKSFNKIFSNLNEFQSATTTIDEEYNKVMNTDNIDDLTDKLNNIKNERADDKYNFYKNKLIFVPSEDYKDIITGILRDEIGDRVYTLKIIVNKDIDELIIVDPNKI